MATVVDSRLKSFEHHVEDMRQLTLCKICLKPFYEPFILACGHTYCYGCLSSWFGGGEDRRKRKNCPDCRADVITQPAPNYLLRDLVQLFVNRAELLPEDETVEEHNRGKQEEALRLAADRSGRGLFGGIFARGVGRIAALPLVDYDDHVTRCPTCAWELEDGICLQCGWEQDSFDYTDFSADGFSIADDVSIMSASDHATRPEPPPRHFYGIGTDGEDSETDYDDYGTPREVDQYDENDDFIDNGDYEEVDDDGLDGHISDVSLAPSSLQGAEYINSMRVRTRSARLTPSEQLTDYDESDDEEPENPTLQYPQSSAELSSSEDSLVGEESLASDEASNGEDWEDEDVGHHDVSRISAQHSTRRGRHAIVISDDEEEEDDEGVERDHIDQNRTKSSSQNYRRRRMVEDNSGTTSHGDSRTSSTGSSEEVPRESIADSDTEESDDTILPAQSRNRRRQRLNTHRSRRTEPSPYQSLAGVNVPSRPYSNQQRGYGSSRQQNRQAPRRGRPVGYAY